MSVTICETTVRTWIKNHTKEEIADMVEDQFVRKDARIAFLTKALDQAINLANIRVEVVSGVGDEDGEGTAYVYCDTCGTPFMSALAQYLEEKKNV